MHGLKFLLLVATVAVISVLMRSDADLGLTLCSDPPHKAFAGQVVWIVGASSGIGAGLALEFAKSGAQVVLSARRVDQLRDLAAQCAKLGLAPMVLPMDVTDHSTHQAALDAIIAVYGHVDQLILNAGRSQRNLAVTTPLTVTRDMMELNFFSLVALNLLVLPTMIARRSGRVVVMSSVSGLLGTPVGSSYSATKFALHGYFNALRAEVACHNVRVSIVCPGPVESEITTTFHANPDYPPQAEGEKMPTERCAQLVLRGLHHGHEELWISTQPVLLMAYLATYAPALTRMLMTKVLGPARAKAVQGGTNAYDAKQMLMDWFKGSK